MNPTFLIGAQLACVSRSSAWPDFAWSTTATPSRRSRACRALGRRDPDRHGHLAAGTRHGLQRGHARGRALPACVPGNSAPALRDPLLGPARKAQMHHPEVPVRAGHAMPARYRYSTASMNGRLSLLLPRHAPLVSAACPWRAPIACLEAHTCAPLALTAPISAT